ncbi:MAG: PP2C family protein-serine/threonine phosphatase [Sedimentisphaerales bacterium]
MPDTLIKPKKTKADFTDALYICVGKFIPAQIQKIIHYENYKWQIVDFDKFFELEFNPDNIGTAVIDAESITASHQKKLFEIIELLDRVNIPTVLYGSSDNINTEHFKMLNVIEKSSARQIIPVIKISNVYRKQTAELQNHNLDDLTKNNHAQQLENQLKMAGAVQRDFLPQTLPDSPQFKWAVAFMPADWVSGDIYDITRLDENHIGFYIADAVGHSMPAALLTMFLKQAIQMRQTIGNEYKIFTPLEVVTSLNQKMFAQHLRGCLFATCCYCLLDTDTLTLDYCRAGHPYPILISKNNSPVQLQTRGSLLGVFENAQFEQGSVQLQSGDKLILYSDGAEPFLGTKENGSSPSGVPRTLIFGEDFTNIAALPAKQLTAEFEILARASKDTIELDDITLIALDIQ